MTRLAQEGTTKPRSPATEASTSTEQIADITAEVFGCQAVMILDYDPEFPEEKYLVFCVSIDVDVQTAVRMEREWIDRVQSEVEDWSAARLSIRMAQ